MEQSILTSTKKILNLPAERTEFDPDVITHINSAFFTLDQLGIGPTEGFGIEDAESKWTDFLEEGSLLNSVKTYVYLKVRMLFDPPTTSYLVTAMEKQIEEMEGRISIERENEEWTDSNPRPRAGVSDE